MIQEKQINQNLFIMLAATKLPKPRKSLLTGVKSKNRKSTKGTTTTTQPIDWKLAMMLLAALKEDHKNSNARLMLAVGFFTGLRISDILKLHWGELINQSSLIITEKKTGKQRNISINPILAKIALEVYQGENLNNFLFVSKAYNSTTENKAISVTAANKRIKKIFAAYGIETDNDSSHVMRKTFGYHIWEKHGKTDEILLILSQIFNHASIATTRAYLGITKKVISNIYLAL